MRFIVDYLKGILIGAGAILPGISSGVFCVVFGIYEKLINSVLNLFHDFKKNFLFLLPIGLGGITGVLLVGKLLNFFFLNYPMPTKFCFIGLILGSIPILCKKANQKKGFRLHYGIFLLSAFFIGILSLQLETLLPTLIHIDFTNSSFFYFVLAGFMMSIGIVMPGVSSSVILMTLGVYTTYLNAVANIDFSVLLPLGIGLVIGSVLFLKLIEFLLKTYYTQTFYTIIGFILGSILILYPGFTFSIEGLFSLVLLGFGFWLGLKFEKLDSSS